jgi:large subunit ribosomal protein L13
MKKSTHSTTRKEALDGRKWWVVDANNLPVGRAASQIAKVLKGKHKAGFTPSMDTGDFIVVINAEKVRFSGNKETEKFYFTHTMHPGGEKLTPPAVLREKHPELIIMNAVRRMLPRNNLGRAMLKKFKVYKGDKHPHTAQKPEPLTLSL